MGPSFRTLPPEWPASYRIYDVLRPIGLGPVVARTLLRVTYRSSSLGSLAEMASLLARSLGSICNK